MPTKLMTLTETARVLNISYDRAAFLAREGIIPVVRMGRLYRVDPETLQAWIKSGGQPYDNDLKVQAQ